MKHTSLFKLKNLFIAAKSTRSFVNRYAVKTFFCLGLTAAITLPAHADISADKSIFVTDVNILKQITLQDVVSKLLADSNDSRSANAFIATAPLSIETDRLTNLETLAISNRFDLAPSNGANCGEYRIAFGTHFQFGLGDFTFLIFEARLPNPNPSLGLEGCRPVANFWANLSTMNDVNQRAIALKQFYLQGLAGFAPVIHVNHYRGSDNIGEVSGQIRRNSRSARANTWSFQEFKTSSSGNFLTFLDATVKDVPFPEFAGNTTDINGLAFQNAVLAGLNTPNANLLANTMSSLAYKLPDNANKMSDLMVFASSNTNQDRLANFFDPTSTFSQAIQTKLTAANSTLTPGQVIARTNALTCGGCHGQKAELGNGLVFNTDDQSREFLSTVKEPTQLGVATHVEAENFSQMSGIQTEPTADVGGGLNVGWIDVNDWMSYASVSLPPSASGQYLISLRVAVVGTSANIRVEQPGGAKLYADFFVPPTDGWQSWMTVSQTVSLPQGIQGIALKSLFGQWNINWIEITPIENLRYVVKDSMKNTFLPERKTILNNFLNSCPTCGVNMVVNGDFANGNTGWVTYIDGQANATINLGGTTKDARVSIQNGGNQTWHVQAYQTGLNLQQGKKYQLTFDASTVSPTTFAQFQVAVEKDGGAYDKYLPTQTLSVNTTIKTFTYTFTMPVTNTSARIALNMGMNTGVLAIDNVSLKQITTP